MAHGSHGAWLMAGHCDVFPSFRRGDEGIIGEGSYISEETGMKRH